MMRLALLALLWLTASAAAQDAARLRFAGPASIGASVGLRVADGPSGAVLALILTPEVGSFEAPGLTTDCFSDARGVAFLELPLNAQGALLVSLPLPDDPSLVGLYLVGQAFELRAGLPRTNCASFVVTTAPAEPALFESFESPARQAEGISAAIWASDVVGVVRPAPIGGSGALGSFDHQLGTNRGSGPGGPWVFDTDDQLFPASATLFGRDVRVTDGRFEFLELTIPAGVTVRFEGSRPARILVSGDVRIDGTLDFSGVDVERAAATDPEGLGQPGSSGGPGGGAGGAGGDLPSVDGGSVDGRPGEDLQVVPGSPLDGLVAGTGGGGSPAVPPGADELAVTYGFWGFYSNQAANGAGGGGLVGAGLAGRAIAERAPGGEVGPPGAGGLAIVPPPPTAGSRDAFLIGGSGGGGAGVHPYDSLIGRPPRWARGSGGAGGGGAVLIAAGGELVIGRTGVVRADGGDAASRDDSHGLLLAPGGGGSGGSVLFQAGGAFRNEGLVSAAGGAGGSTEDLRATPGTKTAGGAGGDGSIRVETMQPVEMRDLGVMEPPVGPGTAATLVERDPLTLAASAWVSSPDEGDASALRYEIYTVQDAISVVYSDRAGVGSGRVELGVTPIVLFTRFGRLDAQDRIIPGSEGPWSVGSAPAPPDVNGVQFMVYFELGGQNGVADARVEAVRLTF